MINVTLKGASRKASIGTSARLPGSWKDAHSCANSSEAGKLPAVQVPILHSCSLETTPNILFSAFSLFTLQLLNCHFFALFWVTQTRNLHDTSLLLPHQVLSNLLSQCSLFPPPVPWFSLFVHVWKIYMPFLQLSCSPGSCTLGHS